MKFNIAYVAGVSSGIVAVIFAGVGNIPGALCASIFTAVFTYLGCENEK